MAVTITTIQPQDALSSSRLTINANFSALKAGIDSVQTLLNPSTYTLSGVKSATINDNAVPFSTSIFQVGKGSSLLGNVILGTVGASTSVLINGTGGVTVDQASVTLTSGNLTLSSSGSVINANGNLRVSKELRLPGLSTAYSAIVGLTGAASVNISTMKYLVLKNNSTTGEQTATLSAGNQGQVLEIFHSLGTPGHPVKIATTNFYGLTGGISLTRTADVIKCVYDGTAWYLLNYSPSSFAAGGATSSITFATV